MKNRKIESSKVLLMAITTVFSLLMYANSIVIINKPFQNIKIMRSYSNLIQDRNLVQCYINQEFKSKTDTCSKEEQVEKRGRELRQIFRGASNCSACRRSQYKEEMKKCRKQISHMFNKYLKYKLSSKTERKFYFKLISNFARYVLLLKEKTKEGKITVDPHTNIQNFIDDTVFDMTHKKNPLSSDIHHQLMKTNSALMFQEAPKKLNNTKISHNMKMMLDQKNELDELAKEVDTSAKKVIKKHDRLKFNKHKHSKRLNKHKRNNLPNKFSYRFKGLDQQLAKLKKINKGWKTLSGNKHKSKTLKVTSLGKKSKFHPKIFKKMHIKKIGKRYF